LIYLWLFLSSAHFIVYTSILTSACFIFSSFYQISIFV